MKKLITPLFISALFCFAGCRVQPDAESHAKPAAPPIPDAGAPVYASASIVRASADAAITALEHDPSVVRQPDAMRALGYLKVIQAATPEAKPEDVALVAKTPPEKLIPVAAARKEISIKSVDKEAAKAAFREKNADASQKRTDKFNEEFIDVAKEVIRWSVYSALVLVVINYAGSALLGGITLLGGGLLRAAGAIAGYGIIAGGIIALIPRVFDSFVGQIALGIFALIAAGGIAYEFVTLLRSATPKTPDATPKATPAPEAESAAAPEPVAESVAAEVKADVAKVETAAVGLWGKIVAWYKSWFKTPAQLWAEFLALKWVAAVIAWFKKTFGKSSAKK